MIGAIVLAAGHSRRMGAQKLLLPLRGTPVIALIVDELLRTALRPIVVVIGRDAEAIQSALSGRAVSFVHNPEPEGDMLSSVRCGWLALPVECEAVLIALGDQPGITSSLVNALMGAFAGGDSGIVVPKHGQHRGHPLLLAARFRDEVLTHHAGVGLKGLLAAHPDQIRVVAVASDAALADMDTPEDYERQRAASPH